MKILHVNNFKRVYGTEKYINQIIEYLTERGHENRLFIQKWTPGANGLKALTNTRENLKNLKALVKEFVPDVIHIHNIVNYKLLNYLNSVGPCLKSMHDYRPFCLKFQMRQDTFQICGQSLSLNCFKAECFPKTISGLYRYCADRMSTTTIPSFDKVWVMSHHMKRYMSQAFSDPSRLEMVHYFFDPPNDNPEPPSPEPRIFAAGRLDPEKGFDELIRACAKLKTPYELKIAGSGDLLEELTDLAATLDVKVEFLGYIANEDLCHWYRWSRVVVFPSIAPEPFGLVGLEAMGEARPVVGFDVGGVSDWLADKQTGFLVANHDTEEMARCLSDLLTNHALATSLGQEGRNQLLEKFPSTKHLDKLETAYRELTSS